jgi:putative hydrolase of the HAD superfamily
MRPELIVFDVYNTLLRVSAPERDPEIIWAEAWRAVMQTSAPPFALVEFRQRYRTVIARLHAEARSMGVEYPEVCWEAVVREVLPDCAKLSTPDLDRFILAQTACSRSISIDVACLPVLNWAQARGVKLGIASNAQRYTLAELTHCLAAEGLALSLFDPELRFFSFEHGFSKPNPKAFDLITARAGVLGIEKKRILMVGDREDNDIVPALAAGWQAWQLRPSLTGQNLCQGGSWSDLLLWLTPASDAD